MEVSPKRRVFHGPRDNRGLALESDGPTIVSNRESFGYLPTRGQPANWTSGYWQGQELVSRFSPRDLIASDMQTVSIRIRRLAGKFETDFAYRTCAKRVRSV